MPKKNKFKNKRIDVDPLQIIDLLTIDQGKSHTFSKSESAGPLKKVVIPKGGGIDTYIGGVKYPYPGYPDRITLEIICIAKRSTLTLMRFFASLLKKRNIFKLFLFRKEIMNFIPKWLKFLTWIISKHRLRPQFYSHSVREIYRVLTLLSEREKLGGGPESNKGKWLQIRDLVCMVLEFDDAYRFRIQDVLSELNLDEIKLDERDTFYAEKKRPLYDFGGKENDKI